MPAKPTELRAWTCPRCGLVRDELAHIHAVAHACPAAAGRFVDLQPSTNGDLK